MGRGVGGGDGGKREGGAEGGSVRWTVSRRTSLGWNLEDRENHQGLSTTPPPDRDPSDGLLGPSLFRLLRKNNNSNST